MWLTVESLTGKTAFCALYMGCQYQDDRQSDWNDAIYGVVQQEAFDLRSKGYRVCYLGDMNGHVGDQLGVGVPGNTPVINPNGRRFLNFLDVTDSRHINGECRVPGDWSTRLTTGCGHGSAQDIHQS